MDTLSTLFGNTQSTTPAFFNPVSAVPKLPTPMGGGLLSVGAPGLLAGTMFNNIPGGQTQPTQNVVKTAQTGTQPSGVVSTTGVGSGVQPGANLSGLGGIQSTLGNISSLLAKMKTDQPQNGLQSLLGQISSLSPEQQALLGIGESPEQKAAREAQTKTLDRLISLQQQLATAGAPKETLTNLDNLIAEQNKALTDLTPGNLLRDQTTFTQEGITQGALNREVATRREPVARALSDLLFSRSALGKIQENDVANIQGQIGAAQTQFELQKAIAGLSPNRGLPAGAQSALLSQMFKTDTPATTSDITEYNFAKSQGYAGSFQDYQKQQANLKNTAGSGGTSNPLLTAIMQNPELFNQLTPTVKGQIAPLLAAAGFTQFGKTLNATQQEDLTTMNTVKDLAQGLLATGASGFAGTGGFGAGSVKQFFAKNLGVGGSEGQSVRNDIGEIKGAIAKLRGGTSFTPNEETLMNTYTPGINDSDLVLNSKLESLIKFITTKQSNLLTITQSSAGGGTSGGSNDYQSYLKAIGQ